MNFKLDINYYSALQLTSRAEFSDIKKSYRNLSKLYHPDKNDSEENVSMYHSIRNAYDILSNKEKKEYYDIHSIHGSKYTKDPYSSFKSNNNFTSNPYKKNTKYTSENNDFKEVLNITLNVKIKYSELYSSNTDKIIKYKRFVSCKSCDGSGFEKNENNSPCIFCNETGKIDGKNCKYCHGEKVLYRNTCKKCDAVKVEEVVQELNIKNIQCIPNKKIIEYKGYGHKSKYFKTRCGDLKVHFDIVKHEDDFIRNKYDLVHKLYINTIDLLCGCEKKVILPNNESVNIEIPCKYNPHHSIIKKGLGFLDPKENVRGDLVIIVDPIFNYENIDNSLIEMIKKSR